MESRLSQNIQIIRRRWQLSQAEIGALLGATRRQVSNWETGRTRPDVGAVGRLSVLCGVPVERILGENLRLETLPPAPLATGGAFEAPGDPLQMILHKLEKIEALLRAALPGVASAEESNLDNSNA